MTAGARPYPLARLAAFTSRAALAGALLAAGGLAAAPAFAQDAPGTPDEGGDVNFRGNEIVVTAQFREQDLQSTPIAITALSGEQLEARGQTSVVDIARSAPSVKLTETNQQGPSLQAFIRGIGQADHSPAFEPGVGMYVDDVYIATLTGSLMDLLDVERVEVLRGPQGTLAGMNSIGGAIKLYSKKPRGGNEGFVEVSAGNYARLDVRAAADFTLVEDRLFARISGSARNQDGYVTRYDYACTHPQLAAQYDIPSQVQNSQRNDDCKLGTEGGKSYVAARGSLRWLPTDTLDVTISADITRDDSEAKPQTLIYVGRGDTTSYRPGWDGLNFSRFYPMYTTAPTNGLDLWNPATGTSPFLPYSPWGGAGDPFTNSPYVTYSNYADVMPVDQQAPIYADPKTFFNGWGISGNIEWDVADNLNLTSITAYRSYEAGWVQDFDMTPLSNSVFTYRTESWQFSQELRLAASLFNDAVDLVVGGFYLDRSTNYWANVNQGLLIFAEYDEVPATNWAVFSNASWRITDALELNAGIRYSKDEKTFNFYRFGRPGLPSTPPFVVPYFPCTVDGVDYGVVHVGFCGLNGQQGKFSGDNIDYRVVLQYEWTPELMTYASIATGYKGGGVNPRPYTANQAYPFDPEKLTAYEIGAKTSFLDNRARLNVSAFVNKYSDFIAGVFSRVAAPPNETCFFAPQDLDCSYLVNAGDATLKGLELELTLEPVDNLLIDASASLLDFKYDNLSGCSPALDSSCTAPFGGLGAGLRYGMELAHSPDRQYSAGVQYRFDIGRAGSITPRVDVNYQSSYNTDAVNKVLAVVPEYTLVNARVAWNSYDDDWQVALTVSNLTNELYYTNVAPQDNNATVAGNPGAPRQWYVTVKRRF